MAYKTQTQSVMTDVRARGRRSSPVRKSPNCSRHELSLAKNKPKEGIVKMCVVLLVAAVTAVTGWTPGGVTLSPKAPRSPATCSSDYWLLKLLV